MTLTFLGTGTSQGVPVIGCECAVCTSANPHDQRLRQAALLQGEGYNLLIDAGPDFRQQMLRAGVKHLNAILLTHEHNDHVIGLDDVRPFNFISGHAVSVYTLPRVADEVRRRFEYVFGEPIPGLPRLRLNAIDADTPFRLGPFEIQPINVLHGRLPILGFRFGPLTYLTDVKTLTAAEKEKIKGSKILVINALQQQYHPTHLNLEESLALVAELQPEQAWLSHIGHQMGLAADVSATLPPGVALSYDGLKIEF